MDPEPTFTESPDLPDDKAEPIVDEYTSKHTSERTVCQQEEQPLETSLLDS